jgi:hypothetical protein
MTNSWLNILITLILVLSIFTGCQKTYIPDDDETGEEEPTDYIWDTSTVVHIVLNGNSVSVTPDVAEVKGSKVTITSAGTYSISGILTDGQVIIDSPDDAPVRLLLNNVNITCTKSAPVFVSDAGKVIIKLEKETENYLTDGSTYSSSGEPNAALFSNSFMTIYGEGSLTVTGNYKDGISTDDGLLIKNGTISVTSADDGIRGKDYIIIREGSITINSTGDGLKSDNEEDADLGYIIIDTGIINITSANGDAINAQSDLTINDGVFDIMSGGGASAVSTPTTTTGGRPGQPGGGQTSGGYSGTVSVKALKANVNLNIMKGKFVINSADDAIHSNNSVNISNGTFAISTGDDAIHASSSITIDSGTIEILKCYEGLESASITVNNGYVSVISSDDAFNATKGSATEMNDGSNLYINGGNIYINASQGDGIDSNGNVSMSGGTVIVNGPQSSPEVGFDINGTFNISGGWFIATGPNSGNMIETPSTSSSQYSVKVTTSSNISSSTLFHIEDASGNNLITFKPVRSVYYLVFSSSALKNGSSYSIYTGGTSTGTNVDGVYYEGIYSGGTLKKTFTISGKITSISF